MMTLAYILAYLVIGGIITLAVTIIAGDSGDDLAFISFFLWPLFVLIVIPFWIVEMGLMIRKRINK
jgi:hypothetical protein